MGKYEMSLFYGQSLFFFCPFIVWMFCVGDGGEKDVWDRPKPSEPFQGMSDRPKLSSLGTGWTSFIFQPEVTVARCSLLFSLCLFPFCFVSANVLICDDRSTWPQWLAHAWNGLDIGNGLNVGHGQYATGVYTFSMSLSLSFCCEYILTFVVCLFRWWIIRRNGGMDYMRASHCRSQIVCIWVYNIIEIILHLIRERERFVSQLEQAERLEMIVQVSK